MIINRKYIVNDLELTEYENEWSMDGSLRPSHIAPRYDYIAEGVDEFGELHRGAAGREEFAIEHCENSINRANMYKGFTTLERFEFLRNKVFIGGQVAPASVAEAIQALLDEAIERNEKDTKN